MTPGAKRVCSLLLLVSMFFGGAPVFAQSKDGELRYRVKGDDTLELIAAEYYGDRRHSIFIMVANNMTHPRKLKRGERLKIPISKSVVAGAGDTLTSIASDYLGDPRRAGFLARFNGLPEDSSVALGQSLRVPFHVTHRAAGRETLEEIAAAYFADKRQAELLQRYNFMTRSILEKDELLVVPIHHVQVRASRLPQPDPESTARVEKRRELQRLAESARPDALRAWRDGDFAEIKRVLTPIDIDYLDTELAVELGVLLAATYIAYDDRDSALALFRKVRERAPNHSLSSYTFSPKVREVWAAAGQ